MQYLTAKVVCEVAPPRGERGLKFVYRVYWCIVLMVAPPRGERGLKYSAVKQVRRDFSRSPSWGAWIEIQIHALSRLSLGCRSPSWGAWIEITRRLTTLSQMNASLPLVGSVD